MRAAAVSQCVRVMLLIFIIKYYDIRGRLVVYNIASERAQMKSETFLLFLFIYLLPRLPHDVRTFVYVCIYKLSYIYLFIYIEPEYVCITRMSIQVVDTHIYTLYIYI